MENNTTALVDMSSVTDLADRLADFLPGARDLPKEARMTLAQIGLMHRLDPFTGEIWAIPQRDRNSGQVIGFSIMVGIAGWRASAHRSGEYWGRRFEKCSEEERGWLGAGPKDLAIKCIIARRKTGEHPVEFDGFGLYRQGERTKMNPLQCVRYRAERDAMKAAFPISLNIGNAKVQIVDDNGEVINGDSDHGPDLASLELYEASQEHPPIEAEVRQVAPDPKTEKPASIDGAVATEWKAAVKQLAADVPYYAYDSGDPNLYLLVHAAAACGYEKVTADNLPSVIADLKQRASEQTMEVPA